MENKSKGSNSQELFSETALKKALLFSQVFSMIGIPVVLALIGYWVQRGVQDQQIKRDYVSLAISLLVPKKDGEAQTSPELTNWAIKLLNDSAPVKLSESEMISMKKNGLRPGDILYFSTKEGRVSHAGVYLGNDQFVRAGSSGVKIDDLNFEKNADKKVDVNEKNKP